MNPDIYKPVEIPIPLQPFVRRILAGRVSEPFEMDAEVKATGYCYLGFTPRGRWRGWVGDDLVFDTDTDGPVHLAGQATHKNIRVRMEGPLEQVFVEFTATGQYQLLGILGIDTLNTAVRISALNKKRGNGFDALAKPSSNPASKKSESFYASFLECLEGLADDPLPVPDYITDAVSLLETTRETLRIAAIAETLGKSERHFRRMFTRYTGLKPKEFHSVIRTTRALMWLLEQDPASISRIAADCGYNDQAHLTRAFQQFLGSSPGAFQSDIETTFQKFAGESQRFDAD